MLKFFLVFLLFLIKDAAMRQWCKAGNQYPWSYNGPDNNPGYWADFYPYCNKTNQSPIAVNNNNISLISHKKFVLEGFDKPITKAKIQNVGFTVRVIPEDGVHRAIIFDFMVLNLTHIRFHFGPEDDPGAETVLNGVKYPMEIQYHGHKDRLGFPVILSTLVDVADDDNSDLKPIVDVLSYVTYRNSSTELQSDLDLSSLQPDIDEGFYLYFGGNPIPPCDIPYIFLLYREVQKIGRDQLAQFNTLYSVGEEDASDDCLMGPNARPVQKMDRRWLWYNPGKDGY